MNDLAGKRRAAADDGSAATGRGRDPLGAAKHALFRDAESASDGGKRDRVLVNGGSADEGAAVDGRAPAARASDLVRRHPEADRRIGNQVLEDGIPLLARRGRRCRRPLLENPRDELTSSIGFLLRHFIGRSRTGDRRA